MNILIIKIDSYIEVIRKYKLKMYWPKTLNKGKSHLKLDPASYQSKNDYIIPLNEKRGLKGFMKSRQNRFTVGKEKDNK